MAWAGLTLTVDGRNALNQAQAANRMDIKSVVVGDGVAPSNFRTMKGLVHQLFELTELKIDIVDGRCVLTVDFPKVDYDYYFREIGVMVTTGDGDVLYVYDNCGDDAQYVVTSTGAEETQKRIRISLLISDVANISVTSPSILYVGFDEFDAEVVKLRQAEEDIAALQERTDKLESGKVDKTGDTMTGKLYLEQGSSVFVSNDNGDFDTGYIKIATITWNSLSTGYRLPISLTVNKRYGYTPITMSLYFFTASNEATRKSPLLRAWSFGETKTDVYVINPNGDWMTWEIYLNAYDGLNNNFVEIVDFKNSKVGSDHYVVEFHKNTYVETLPEGVRAETAVSNVLGRIDELGQKMAAIEAVWPHVMWDTGGWNPFTETAPASVINDEAK